MAEVLECTVVQKDACGGCTRLVLKQPALAGMARQGQFLHIRCGEAQLLRRPISICDVEHDTLSIVFEVRGAGTAWLSRRKAGDALDVLGPLGNGFPAVKGRILVAGGGIGVPPMLLTAKCADAADAVLGFRSAERRMLTDAFDAVCGKVLCMSDDGSCGQQGYVADGVRQMLAQGEYAAVMACGPRMMLRTVAAAAQEAGVLCYVSMEERMGCGIGACLVCACKTQKDGKTGYQHVCKDGPVFPAEEVCWDD